MKLRNCRTIWTEIKRRNEQKCCRRLLIHFCIPILLQSEKKTEEKENENYANLLRQTKNIRFLFSKVFCFWLYEYFHRESFRFIFDIKYLCHHFRGTLFNSQLLKRLLGNEFLISDGGKKIHLRDIGLTSHSILRFKFNITLSSSGSITIDFQENYVKKKIINSYNWIGITGYLHRDQQNIYCAMAT